MPTLHSSPTENIPFDQPQERKEKSDAFALLQKPIKYIPHPDFQNPALEGEIIRPIERSKTEIASHLPRDIPPYFASLYSIPLLEKEEEVHLFRQMNFFRFRADQLRMAALTVGQVAESIAIQIGGEMHNQLQKAIGVRNMITEANMRLVVNHAKKIIKPTHHDFFEVVSKGNVVLIEATGTYDCDCGNRFSTYATWALNKRVKEKDRKQLRHSRHMEFVEDSSILAETPVRTTSEEELLSYHNSVHSYLHTLLAGLEERLRGIIIDRFGITQELSYGLENSLQPLTLIECGSKYGVTKQRIQKLQEKALSRLKEIARCTNYEMPTYIVP